MDIEILKSRVSDNFFYALVDGREIALIDPVDGTRAVQWVRQQGLELRYLINTHFHQDHTGGNGSVLGEFPGAALVVGQGDAQRVADQGGDHEIDRRVSGGDTLPLGDSTLRFLDTPGHTPGHVSVTVGDHLFSGDTIFVGGAGNCNFGGDPGKLFRTFRDVLSEMDDAVRFYPGHDYSVRDLEFILSLEPDNEAAAEHLDAAQATGDDEIYLTTLGEERSFSPFFRYDDRQLRERLADEHAETWESCRERSRGDAEAAFRTVRQLRNAW